MDKQWYPISTLLQHAYHTMDHYHRTRCIFEPLVCVGDCENKMQQLQEFYGLFIGVN